MRAMTTEALDELIHETAILCGRVARLLDPVRLRVWEERGITFPQLRILFRVRLNPEIDLRSLADGLEISPSAASQQVDKLVERGFILRSEDPQDRRRLRLTLTSQGEEAAGEYSRAAIDYSTRVVSTLPEDDLRDLRRLLGTLIELNTPPPPLPHLDLASSKVSSKND
jgi:DNA-binding MarR family transcriptional regulator